MDPRCFLRLVASDLYRIEGDASAAQFFKHLSRGVAFKFIFWMRVMAFVTTASPGWRALYPVARLMYRRYTFKFGISIPYETRVGSGFYIGHFGGIVVTPGATIGKNCNLSQGVTIGQVNRGPKKGTPTIGDNVYIGPGAKVLGKITVGDNVAIGANAVVVKDVPHNAVVGGVPARIISEEGSGGYINRTDYPPIESAST
jgi:serine O-acetyltransferase